MLEWIRFILTAALMLCGLFILFTATVGVYKFDHVLSRMHAAALGDTLGLLFCLMALAISGFAGEIPPPVPDGTLVLLDIALPRGQKHPVHTGPGEGYVRALGRQSRGSGRVCPGSGSGQG